MHITRYTNYALRVLVYVALHSEKICTIREIAESYKISKNHLMKVVQELNNKGYLSALRGKNGGLRLNRKPQDIRIGAVVRDMEQDLALAECFSDRNRCIITPSCQLKQLLNDALHSFLLSLDQYTLADLISAAGQPQRAKMLGIED